MEVLNALTKSKFRSSFKLNNHDKNYISKIGIKKLEFHAKSFIIKRLAPAKPKNDGKQTPFKGHPVFKAQHATATCCRDCLSKWHKIPKNSPLNPTEISHIQRVIMCWIRGQLAQ